MKLSKLQEIADRRTTPLAMGGSGYIVEGDRPVACFLPFEDEDETETVSQNLSVALQDAYDIVEVMNALPELIKELTETRAFMNLVMDDGK